MSSKTNVEEDEDRLFLEHVLDKLYDFGNGAASKKKLKSEKKKKKKKRKRPEEEEEEEEELRGVCSDIDDNRADRVVAEHEQKQPKTDQPGANIQRVSQVEVVTFQDPRKKLKTKQTPAADTVPAPQVAGKKQSDQPEELSLEKARLEVHRFGITGYKKEQQRVFEQDRAVMLGARPPKKDYVNYKTLQQQIKEKKQKAKEDVQSDMKKKKKKKQSKQRDKTKKVSPGSGTAPTGQVGRFKNGMLILSSKEIQKIKGNKRGK